MLNHGAPARAADLTLEKASAYLIPVEINRQQLRLRVDLAASGYIILNPAAARRVGLGGSFVRSQTFVGPHRLVGGSNGTRINVAGTQLRERVAFFDRNVVDDADGLISPELLPYDTVTFQVAAPNSSDRTFEIPLFFSKGAGLVHRYAVGQDVIGVDFSPVRPTSIATAAAGALLAAQHGGSWSGEIDQQVISFGIERPVRAMSLERPLMLHGLDVRRFLVRTSDHRGAHTLPSDAPEDAGEIVVTGRSRQQPSTALTIGLDRLSSCSSLTYRKATRLLILRCAG
jgi:hypothetical protein